MSNKQAFYTNNNDFELMERDQLYNPNMTHAIEEKTKLRKWVKCSGMLGIFSTFMLLFSSLRLLSPGLVILKSLENQVLEDFYFDVPLKVSSFEFFNFNERQVFLPDCFFIGENKITIHHQRRINYNLKHTEKIHNLIKNGGNHFNDKLQKFLQFTTCTNSEMLNNVSFMENPKYAFNETQMALNENLGSVAQLLNRLDAKRYMEIYELFNEENLFNISTIALQLSNELNSLYSFTRTEEHRPTTAIPQTTHQDFAPLPTDATLVDEDGPMFANSDRPTFRPVRAVRPETDNLKIDIPKVPKVPEVPALATPAPVSVLKIPEVPKVSEVPEVPKVPEVPVLATPIPATPAHALKTIDDLEEEDWGFLERFRPSVVIQPPTPPMDMHEPVLFSNVPVYTGSVQPIPDPLSASINVTVIKPPKI